MMLIVFAATGLQFIYFFSIEYWQALVLGLLCQLVSEAQTGHLSCSSLSFLLTDFEGLSGWLTIPPIMHQMTAGHNVSCRTQLLGSDLLKNFCLWSVKALLQRKTDANITNKCSFFTLYKFFNYYKPWQLCYIFQTPIYCQFLFWRTF